MNIKSRLERLAPPGAGIPDTPDPFTFYGMTTKGAIMSISKLHGIEPSPHANPKD